MKDIKAYFETENLLRALQTATHTAELLRVPVSVSIVDASGLPLVFLSMKDAKLVSKELAPKKAYTSVIFQLSTKDLQVMTQPGASFFQIETMLEGKIVTFGGGIPLYLDKLLVGAVGVSGGTPEQDHQIAQAVADSFFP
ncbi:GlcG/HbpS family heme-binding protein [Chryseobacterium gossypii]|uniref:GlcG/HbpS family heme-binding protein n=1 Tax=Chryseobacterium gossypii TaxID=3231602 RepID=UPI0035242CE1